MIGRTAIAITALLIGCGGDDPLTYSAPVGINLKAKSGDAKGGVVSDEKGITTETGNPFGKFMTDARAILGRDPGRVAVASLELTLGAQSKNVTALEQVFGGEVTALLLINDTNNTFNAGTVNAPKGGGPVPLAVLFDWAALNDADRAKFYQGSFKVVVRGPAAAGFDTKDAEGDLMLTFTFSAFE